MEQITKKKHGLGAGGEHIIQKRKKKKKKHMKQLTLDREIEYLLFFRLYG